MRKAERLFQIIQILRRSSRPVTAAQLANELEVAKRTIYRDIAHLIGQRVPVDGEAGFGYVLDPQYDMPPLMLTPDEIEAVLLGVQMVEKLGDAAITNAAKDVIAKITSTLPGDLLPFIAEPAVSLRPGDSIGGSMFDTRPLRRAIREGRKIKLEYCAVDGEVTHRIVWPVLLGYADARSLLIAWCESKQAFRHFRTERILDLEVLEETIGLSKRTLRQQWRQFRETELSESRPTP
ncbi:YafY family transcriptional regulator [Rhizobium ruizarguesonis]|jgi:predicted DNA-binding transcriptional regulator YafY|uniref:helix-turn-helix transcriptional regulator n=1 Tax=Rhizobium ruizarguesonis TaxID=2081791 RepID=UPI001030342B|nr:YafY family protein [Rhizobium ruizarguesonis]NEH75733.1 WYL domain-containing protein [Rhizobium ruizarguesonis]NEJ16632.1 WYL domain-containing protein [Rhizobium ruizarguesonis]NEJ85559.1 WYL domain-containing protein [Rhizobium ruizarguesonis]NEK30548.1 WYL domain-containing protein [Rhizobium ruizarguesonis]TAT73517.1 YafY family transcriptional regulator [Rhizobium ruizarguesonis]